MREIPADVLKHYPKARWAEGSRETIIAFMSPPINYPCSECGAIMDVGEVYGSDWKHKKCANYLPYISLVSGDGKVEWNARFMLGDKKAEELEHGKTYEFGNKKWRCVKA